MRPRDQCDHLANVAPVGLLDILSTDVVLTKRSLDLCFIHAPPPNRGEVPLRTLGDSSISRYVGCGVNA